MQKVVGSNPISRFASNPCSLYKRLPPIAIGD